MNTNLTKTSAKRRMKALGKPTQKTKKQKKKIKGANKKGKKKSGEFYYEGFSPKGNKTGEGL
jgi:hypothetical protein